MKNNAATYLRSSKDRNDVSPAAQARKLEELAAQRGLRIVAEFSDSEESGKTDDRPDFARLLGALKNPNRGWTHLLVYDTSRIARRRYIAQAFKHQAKRRGVTIHYATLPADLDPIAEVILESSFEAMDEVWSLMSRTKGLMGMRENVSRGFRAGGRAPIGYQLERVSTGAVRDGKPVTKSRLVLSADAPKIRAYLIGRARGIPRARLGVDMQLPLQPHSLIGVEWNALTYAGHTVWNVHREQGTGSRRRPREEWVIQRDTHEALITEAQAEHILGELTNSHIGARVSRAKSAMSDYLLTGMMFTSDGRPWTGKNDGRHYRLKPSPAGPGKLVACDMVDRAVLAQITADMQSDAFLGEMLEASRAAGLLTDPVKPLRERRARLEREKTRAAELALSVEDATPFTHLVQQRSEQIAAVTREMDAIEADATLTIAIRELTPGRLRELLFELGGPQEALQALVGRVVLDPDLGCAVHYRAAGGLSMASPRPSDGWVPGDGVVRRLKVG